MRTNLYSLQAGRALAALAVAAYHLTDLMGLPRYGGHEVFLQYTRLGNRGVDFFFVLSGFIILFAHIGDIGNPLAWRRYLYRRFVRVYPIYWLYTLLFAWLLLVVGSTDAKLPHTAADWLTSLSLVRFTDAMPPLPVAWSLFHEVAFYVLFSVLLLGRRAGMLALAAFMLVALASYQFPTEDAATPLKVYTAAYNLYFLFGMAACLAYRRGGSGVPEAAAGLAITVLALATMPLPHALSPMVLVAGFALLLTGVAKLEAAGRLVIPPFLAFVGDASFTIYLTHVSLEGLLLKVAMKSRLYPALGGEATFMLVLGGTVLLGCLAYAMVERPLLNALRRRSRRAPAQPEVPAQDAARE